MTAWKRIGGDFFESVPEGADAYVLRLVIHDWLEDKAVAILKNARQAMRPNARLVVLESAIPEGPEHSYFKWLDLHMLASVRERTASEYGELLAKCGFDLEQIIRTCSAEHHRCTAQKLIRVRK